MRWTGLALFALVAAASPALAQLQTQNRAEPWRAPTDQPGSRPLDNRARVTSDASATEPSPAEQRQARLLAAALFAKPGAAQRAADKAAPAVPPDYAEVQPKPEWTDTAGVAPGGRGVKVTRPF